METAVILEELRQIRAALEGINKRLSKTEFETHFEPRTVTLQQASRLLSQGLTKTKLMIRSGELETVAVGARRMVPLSEINRLATPVPKHQSKAQAKVIARWKPIAKKRR